MLGRPGRAVKIDDRAQRQHEIVVGERRHAVDHDLLLGQVDALDRTLVEGPVRVPVQQLADRVADLGRPELVGGDLIQQRLKRVVVVLVDDREPHRRVAQFLRGPDAAETGAQDHDVWQIRP